MWWCVVVLHTLYNNHEPIAYIASMPVVGAAAGAQHSRISHRTYIVYCICSHIWLVVAIYGWWYSTSLYYSFPWRMWWCSTH